MSFRDSFAFKNIHRSRFLELAGSTLDDISADIHASVEYRRAMIPVFTQRALERAMARVQA